MNKIATITIVIAVLSSGSQGMIFGKRGGGGPFDSLHGDFFSGGQGGAFGFGDPFGSRFASSSGSLFNQKNALSDKFFSSLDFGNDHLDSTKLAAASSDDYAAATDLQEAHESVNEVNLSHKKNQQIHIVDQSSLDFQHKTGNRDLVDFSDKVAASKDSALDYQDVTKDKTALSKKEAQDYNAAYAAEESAFEKFFEEGF